MRAKHFGEIKTFFDVGSMSQLGNRIGNSPWWKDQKKTKTGALAHIRLVYDIGKTQNSKASQNDDACEVALCKKKQPNSNLMS